MRRKITGRELRRGTPEETLAPGESLKVTKKGGKVFELRRVDVPDKDMLRDLDELLREVPSRGEIVRTDLVAIITQDRE